MGVSEATILHWETGETKPEVRLWPAVIAFLGYDPLPPPTSLPERMKRFRVVLGLSIREAASRLAVDSGTWAAWECGRVFPWPRYLGQLEALLEN